ncbi:MAG TPA: ABC transporter permease [Vicinamibacterales bacterium]|jgi:putative ABC transport system permease protein
MLDALRQDLRYGLRSFRKSPGFTIVAVATLAVGIGAATAIYTVVDAILLQPLPFPDADRLVRVVENVPFIDAARPPAQRGVTYPEFLEWRARTKTLTNPVALIAMAQRSVQTPNGTARVFGVMTSGSTFRLLGVHALLGRTLLPDDDADPNVAVLSYDAWKRLFQGDPHIVGKGFEIRAPGTVARVMTAVGVLEREIENPSGISDFYTPIALDPARPPPFVQMIGRLQRGVSLQTANDEANVIGAAVRPPRPADAPPLAVPRFEVQGLKDRLVQPMRPALRVLLAAVGVVLLIVCANVANLLLARGTARQREMAVRFGLGATRARLVRQILTECLMLAVVGGVLGTLLASLGVMLMARLGTIEAPGLFRLVFGATILPRAAEVAVDVRMLRIAVATTAIASVVFGVLPALHLSNAGQLQAMGLRSARTGRSESRLRAALVIGQLTLATVLLVGAGLLIHSFARLSVVDMGYDPSNVAAAQLVFPADYSIARKSETIASLLDGIRAIPAVKAAGFSRAGFLISEELVIGTIVPQGRTLAEMRAEASRPRVRSVSHDYLRALNVRILEGRGLQESDGANALPALVINRTVARRLFSAGNSVGQFVDWYPLNKGGAVQAQIVGVSDDVHNTTPDREPFAEIFVDYRQLLAVEQKWGDSAQQQDVNAIGFLSFAIRTTQDPAATIPAISRAIRSIDGDVGIESILPMERLAAGNLARQRFYTLMLTIFAAVAAFLAAIGIYGVLAYGVIQRTQEIGIRMALGAQRIQVLALILRKGAALTALGIGLGLAAAAASTRLLQGLLFGITPLDPSTFAAVAALFGLVAALASFVPARRATRVDPMVALRAE